MQIVNSRIITQYLFPLSFKTTLIGELGRNFTMIKNNSFGHNLQLGPLTVLATVPLARSTN